MILDILNTSTIARYGALNPLFARAFEFLIAAVTNPPADGRYELDGEDLFALVGDHTLKQPQDAALEAHDRYIDIQYMLRGAEGFGWRSRGSCSAPRGVMDAEKDILFFDDAPATIVTAREGEFVAFFPADAHAPLMAVPSAPTPASRKIIIKVKN